MIDLPGWSRDQVLDQIDFPFFEKLLAEWGDAPPIRRAAAAGLGIKPKPRAPKPEVRAQKNFEALQAMFPGGKFG